MNNYNHKKNELELLQKITDIVAFILELYLQGKITSEVKDALINEVKRWKNTIKIFLF